MREHMAMAKRQPVAGVDYDADAPMEQDDYEWFTSTGQYAGNGWAEEQERKAARKKWADRAVELAEARNLTGTARLERDGENGARYTVPSADRRGTHSILFFREGGEGKARCTCNAAQYRNPCAHAGAVLVAERQRAAALAATAETFDSFRHNCGGW